MFSSLSVERRGGTEKLTQQRGGKRPLFVFFPSLFSPPLPIVVGRRPLFFFLPSSMRQRRFAPQIAVGRGRSLFPRLWRRRHLEAAGLSLASSSSTGGGGENQCCLSGWTETPPAFTSLGALLHKGGGGFCYTAAAAKAAGGENVKRRAAMAAAGYRAAGPYSLSN